MSIKEEIHKALAEIQQRVTENAELTENEMEMLFLAALIEEEA